MKKNVYLLIIALALAACQWGKTPQSPMDSEDTIVVEEIDEVDEVDEAESDDGYTNLGNVHCEYYDKSYEKYCEYNDAVLFAKVLSNNSEYYYVSLKKGRKKYPVTKCEPSQNRGCNGKFMAGDVRYLVYIQSWDNTGSQKDNIYENNGESNNTRTIVVEHKRELQQVQKWQNCGGCGGSTLCGTCGGSGRNPFSSNPYEECPQCYGNRKCTMCGGRGGWYYTVLE